MVTDEATESPFDHPSWHTSATMADEDPDDVDDWMQVEEIKPVDTSTDASFTADKLAP